MKKRQSEPIMDISIIKEGVNISHSLYKVYIEKLLTHMKMKGSVGVLFTNNEGIKKYNKKFRGKNSPTDVLSFDGEDGHLGDIIISVEWVREESRKEITKRIKLLIIHAVLHLSGVEHTYEIDELKENWAKMEKIYNDIEGCLK